ncbi:hypothetical protein BJX70DRAFT_398536 [Aspergillus crustosus]
MQFLHLALYGAIFASLASASAIPNLNTPTRNVTNDLGSEDKGTDPLTPRLVFPTYTSPPGTTIRCMVPKAGSVYKSYTQKAIEKLRKAGGKPTLPAGDCTRVACHKEAAIHWCNNSKKTRSLPSFNNIADGAQVILDQCSQKTPEFDGELSHWDQWTAVVKNGDC